MTIKIFTCLRCGHQWPSKQERPLTCSRCKTPYHDRPRILESILRDLEDAHKDKTQKIDWRGDHD